MRFLDLIRPQARPGKAKANNKELPSSSFAVVVVDKAQLGLCTGCVWHSYSACGGGIRFVGKIRVHLVVAEVTFSAQGVLNTRNLEKRDHQ